MKITVAVTAKNEEGAIRRCLASLAAAIEHAERESAWEFDLVVVLNDSTDGTEGLIPDEVEIVQTSGGLVEAQRAVADRAPFVIFSDADILVDRDALLALTRVMFEQPELRVAYPRKTPLSPARKSLLAKSLHTYNLNDGFETQRSHFNGKLFAIRGWAIPEKSCFMKEVDGRFLNLREGVRADDIYLSKSILADGGKDAIQEVQEVAIRYRAPETFEGMYRYYRRMRMELTRVAILFPELRWPAGPKRGTDWQRLGRAEIREQFHWLVFQGAFRLCETRYFLEEQYYRWFSRKRCAFWPPVEETKTMGQLERLTLPDVSPLEIWDLVVEERTLWEWQEDESFPEMLSKGLKEIKTGKGKTASKGAVLAIAANYDDLHLTGGRSQDRMIRAAIPHAKFCEKPVFSACEGALERWPKALVVDVGQTQIKVAYGKTRSVHPRDLELLPVGEMPVKNGELLAFIRGSLPSIQPREIILALPCYVHPDLALGGSSYAEMKGNQSLLDELSSHYPEATWIVLNDAELATLAVPKKPKKKTLVVTLGFGVGGCILETK